MKRPSLSTTVELPSFLSGRSRSLQLGLSCVCSLPRCSSTYWSRCSSCLLPCGHFSFKLWFFARSSGCGGMSETPSPGFSFSLPSTESGLQPTDTTRLVGKLLHSRKFNFTALKSVLAAAWKLGDIVTFSQIHSGFIVCHFRCSTDLENVLKLGPWNFCGSLIVFSRWDADSIF